MSVPWPKALKRTEKAKFIGASNRIELFMIRVMRPLGVEARSRNFTPGIPTFRQHFPQILGSTGAASKFATKANDGYGLTPRCVDHAPHCDKLKLNSMVGIEALEGAMLVKV